MQIFEDRATTAIYVRIKRYDETHFIIADEYETLDKLKGRLLAELEQIQFKLKGQEEPLTTEDIQLRLKKKVSAKFLNLSRVTSFLHSRFSMEVPHYTISRSSTTLSCGCYSRNQEQRMSSMI